VTETYVPNFTRLQLGTLVGSVVNDEDVIAAMIQEGKEDVYVPGISDAIGGIVEVKVLNKGIGYTGGPYNNIEFRDTGSATGLFATGDFQVVGGELNLIVIQNAGQAYKKGDQLTVNDADVGGAGSGFLCEVVLVQPG
jgi:hypothetical protein